MRLKGGKLYKTLPISGTIVDGIPQAVILSKEEVTAILDKGLVLQFPKTSALGGRPVILDLKTKVISFEESFIEYEDIVLIADNGDAFTLKNVVYFGDGEEELQYTITAQ